MFIILDLHIYERLCGSQNQSRHGNGRKNVMSVRYQMSITQPVASQIIDELLRSQFHGYELAEVQNSGIIL
jgi:hypothetical protein